MYVVTYGTKQILNNMYENLSYSLKVYLAVVLLTYNKQQCSELECKNVLLDIYIISHKVP